MPRKGGWRREGSRGRFRYIEAGGNRITDEIDQYLDGITIEDFRSRHLRVVGARDLGLDKEEQAQLSLLRSWRIKQSRAVA